MAQSGSDVTHTRPLAGFLPRAAARPHVPVPVLILLLSLIWPTNLALTLGGLNLPCFRIAILLLAPFSLMEVARNPFRLRLPDFLIIAYGVLQGVSLVIQHGLTANIVSYYNGLPVTTNALVNSGATFVDTIGAYFAARIYLRNEEQFTATMQVFVFIVITIGATTLVESITGFSIFGERTKAYGGARLGLERANGPFPHPILWGLFAASAFAFAAMDRPGQSPVTRFLLMSFVALATFTSLSSGAFLALVVQIALIGWNVATRGIARRWLVLAGLFAAAYVFIDILSNRSPILVFTSYATLDSGTAYYRTLIWRFGWPEFLNSPIIGIGFNDWARVSWMSASVDTFWLAILLRYGLLGAGPLCVSILIALWRVGTATDERRKRGLAGPGFAWVICMVGIIIAGFTVHLWAQAYIIFMFLLGAWTVFAGGASRTPRPKAR